MLTFPTAKEIKAYRPSKDLVYSGLILLVALVVYSGGWNNGFLVNWDDASFVTENPDIQSFTLANLYKIFTTYCLGTYAPIQLLSYMLDYSLWGPRPTVFLLVNVVFHGLSACLFYRILCRMHFTSGWALFAALLFTVHPVQVEGVAWISQRRNVLAMTFFLAAFWQYLNFTETNARRWRPYALSLGFFLLALLTKSVTVILPAILLSYDFLLREQRKRLSTIAAEKLPFALLALAGAVLAVISQAAEYGGGRAEGVLGGSGLSAALTMLTVYKGYLFNLFWPLHLSAEYRVVIKHVLDGEVFLSAALLVISLVSVLLVGQDRRRSASFWLAVFFIGFLPVSQIVPFIHPMNDRYLYFPMLGFAAVLALLLQSCVVRIRVSERTLRFAGVAALLLLAVLSWQRTGVWGSSLSLWQDAVAKQPEALSAWANLGNTYEKAGDFRQALVSYQRALALNDKAYEIHYVVGALFLELGELDAAAQHLGRVLELSPGYDKALYSLGYVYLLNGQYAAAVSTLESGLQRAPEALNLRIYLGASYYCLGNYHAARQVYAQVERSGVAGELPSLATGMLSLVALRQGDPALSRHFWEEAVAGGSSEADIYLNWARLEAIGRHRDEALRFLAAASEHGAGDLAFLADDITFRSLHGDVEFLRLVRL